MGVARVAGGGAGVVGIGASIAGGGAGVKLWLHPFGEAHSSQLRFQPEPVAGAMWWCGALSLVDVWSCLRKYLSIFLFAKGMYIYTYTR